MVRIDTPDFSTAWRRLNECKQSRQHGGDPLNMRLLGVSGVGKSFLLRQYRDAHPRRREIGRTVVPVAYVPIPSGPSVKAIYVAMLEALGMHGVAGTADALRHRTTTLYQSCGVELCLFDELNHFVDGGRLRLRQAASDALKVTIESIGLPSVFTGAKRSHILFEQNMQLRSRATSSLTLRPYDLTLRFAELQGFVLALAGQLLEAPAAEQLARSDMAERIFYATDGIHRNVSRLLHRLQHLGLTKDDQMTPGNLAQVFRTYFWEDAPDRLNPFCQGFEYRRLCRSGEPYVPTELDGDNHDESH